MRDLDDLLAGLVEQIQALNGRVDELERQPGPNLLIPWTDYSAISTITGWSAYTTQLIYYKKIGKRVDFEFFIAGTSNTTTARFTLPYASAASGLIGEGLVSRAQDNGAAITTACAWELSSGANIVNCYTNHALGAWTAANAKRVIGQGWYETA